MFNKVKSWISDNPDLSFAILLSICVYAYFGLTNELFPTHRTGFAIMERFAVLGLVGLALTLCIIAGEIDLSIEGTCRLQLDGCTVGEWLSVLCVWTKASNLQRPIAIRRGVWRMYPRIWC